MIPIFLTFYYDPNSPNEDWEAYGVKGFAQWQQLASNRAGFKPKV